MNLSHRSRCLIYAIVAIVSFFCFGQEIGYHGYVQAVLFALIYGYTGYQAQVEWAAWSLEPRKTFFYGPDGWPVELFIGRPFTNFLRLLIHTDLRVTWRNWRHNRRPNLSSEDETTRTFTLR